jgi:hypothetical protein
VLKKKSLKELKSFRKYYYVQYRSITNEEGKKEIYQFLCHLQKQIINRLSQAEKLLMKELESTANIVRK